MFSRGLKLEAIRMVKERGLSIVPAGRDLEIGEGVLRRWIRESSSGHAQAFPGQAQVGPERHGPEPLRREDARSKAERDILGKAAAGFARESP